MDNIGRLWSQVAAEAGCTTNKAKVAVYLMDLACSGVTVDRAAALLKRKPDFVKRYAREFIIDFADYKPFSRQIKAGKPRPDPRCVLRA